jgi:hypothetical protein
MATKIFVFVPAFGGTIQATTFLTTHALQQHLASKNIQGAFRRCRSRTLPSCAAWR